MIVICISATFVPVAPVFIRELSLSKKLYESLFLIYESKLKLLD